MLIRHFRIDVPVHAVKTSFITSGHVSAIIFRRGSEQRPSSMRAGFAAAGKLNHSNRSRDRLSAVFDEINKHASSIQLQVDLHDVMKVYRWTNPYLHAGWRDFVWVPGYVLQFLRPLFVGPDKGPLEDRSINGGIQMPREVWRAVRAHFEESGRRKGNFREVWRAVRAIFRKLEPRGCSRLNEADEA